MRPIPPTRSIEEQWDETVRLGASIRPGIVSASVLLRELTDFPRQNPVARALRKIGRIERTLSMLDWFDDPEQRRGTGSILNKGEARNVLARAIVFNRFGELRDRTVYLDRAVRHLHGNDVDVPG